MTNTTFENNKALGGGGGAFYWDLNPPEEESCTYSGNTALYGSRMASEFKSIL
jgi:hypothetical protein